MSDSGSESAREAQAPEAPHVELSTADTLAQYLKRLAAVLLEDPANGADGESGLV